MSNTDFLGRATTILNKATELDKAGNNEDAYTTYMDGLEVLMKAIKWEKLPETKKVLQFKAGQYLQRAETLKARINGKSESQKPSAMGANGKASNSSGKDKDEDEQDADSKKLRGALQGAILTSKPDVRWEDVAGLEGAKDSLKEAVILPARFPHLFTGKRQPWKGVLLYGPPGTGKSFLAKAVATEANSTFFSVSSSDLVSKWMGESERLVKQLFAMARENKPSIIFIDEIDALCGPRGEGESEASRRIKTELLVQMDGVGRDSTGVLILGATNIPWQLDAAIRRRFQRRVHIGLPDKAARQALIQSSIGNSCELSLDQLKRLVDQTEGYSGSDIAIAMQDALMEPIRTIQMATHYKQVNVDGVTKWTPCSKGDPAAVEMDWTKLQGDELLEPPLNVNTFTRSIATVRPSVSKDDIARHDDWTKEFGSEGA